MERTIGFILLLALVVMLLLKGLFGGGVGADRYQVLGEGKTLRRVAVSPTDYGDRIKAIEKAAAGQDAVRKAALEELDKHVIFSWPRTIGLWIAAFLTLCIMSFLYKDSPMYRLAESVFVGTSAAYWMVVTFWQMGVPIALGRLFPRFVKFNLAPGHDITNWLETLATKNWLGRFGLVNYEAAVEHGLAAPWYLMMNWWYWIPMIFGVLLLWRLAPSGQWISRWPLAFVIGGTAGLRMVAYLQADFVAQIRNSLDSLIVLRNPVGVPYDFDLAFYFSLNNIVLLLGFITVLVYFFFSLEHKGVVGKVSRVGIWVLMITFGAGFGFTVMGRIALLVGRFQFLVNDWFNYKPY